MRSSLDPKNRPFRNRIPSLARVSESGKNVLPVDQRLDWYLSSSIGPAVAALSPSFSGGGPSPSSPSRARARGSGPVTLVFRSRALSLFPFPGEKPALRIRKLPVSQVPFLPKTGQLLQFVGDIHG